MKLVKLKLAITFILIAMLATKQSAFTQTQNNKLSSTLKSSGYAPVHGLKMYYEIHGEGMPLVLLHGSFMTIDLNYGELIAELAKTNKVIAVEFQGHGRTTDSKKAISYNAFADDIAGVLDHLEIDSANVLGYSLGGTTALQLAILYPKKVRKIIFISSVFSEHGWLPSVRSMIAEMKPEFLTHTPLKTAYDSIAPDTSNWNNFLNKIIAFERKPYDLGIDKIKKLKSPILIINGDYDGVDVAHSMELFTALGGGEAGIMEPLSKSQFAIIPGTTHVTVMMQTSQLINFITPFLK